MPKRTFENRLNDLTNREWLLFQKSWFVHRPAPREKDVLLHPAKFPEDLIQQFIEFFTKRGQTVLDPMAGTGSTLVAAFRSGRDSVGIELQPKYAEVALQRLQREQPPLGGDIPSYAVHCADARQIAELDLPEIDYCITSPPYWDMLKAKGFETQKERAEAGLDVHYSDDDLDLGNIDQYERFLEELEGIYRQVHAVLREGAYLTVIVKNIKKGGRNYPLAWDLAARLSRTYQLRDEKIWCQDDQRLAPYGMGNVWVSNTMHQYCLVFRKMATP
jgi:DNA modification methylase